MNHANKFLFLYLDMPDHKKSDYLHVSTVRPGRTRPHGTRTSLGHDFKKGSKNFEISDFGTQTSWDTILRSVRCSRIANLCNFIYIIQLYRYNYKTKSNAYWPKLSSQWPDGL